MPPSQALTPPFHLCSKGWKAKKKGGVVLTNRVRLLSYNDILIHSRLKTFIYHFLCLPPFPVQGERGLPPSREMLKAPQISQESWIQVSYGAGGDFRYRDLWREKITLHIFKPGETPIKRFYGTTSYHGPRRRTPRAIMCRPRTEFLATLPRKCSIFAGGISSNIDMRASGPHPAQILTCWT